MATPQRWNIDANVAPHDAGQWVTWEDYCRLNKSLDVRLKLQNDGVERELKEWHRMWTEQTNEVRRLEAEVERLKEVVKAQAKGLDDKFGREGGQP